VLTRLARHWLGVAAWLCACLTLTGCGPREPWRHESYVFGTRVELQIWGGDKDAAQTAATEVLHEFDRLHRDYHAWQPSQLTALNTALAQGRPATVSDELAALVTQAAALAKASDGLFEPSLGKLVALWGFHHDTPRAELPRSATLNALANRRLTSADLRINGLEIRSHNKDLALDFGGFLKGVALDRTTAILRTHGIDNALINIGGNIKALGSKGGTPWRVGISHPRPDTVGGVPLASLDLRDGEAIGTSGDYHRFFELGGKRYFHLIDPRTARPAWGTQALTILIVASDGNDTGTRSDALSKPLFIAGDTWPDMAKKLHITHALRVTENGHVELSPAMQSRLTMEVPDVQVTVRE
jgi:FAD:protein FMN transferase